MTRSIRGDVAAVRPPLMREARGEHDRRVVSVHVIPRPNANVDKCSVGMPRGIRRPHLIVRGERREPGRIAGTVVATRKDDRLAGFKLKSWRSWIWT